ncbi:hypothetical protein JRO89_XSUnG0001700 [Xanthoceras sorbifolium]|uniref:Uncharacterized protein n=1 Tax=Xanthoceras sorbifolium TaxID=99658 RepID=A0ABQ8H0D8_9ROSI|nr:hypothetical protein JRO89_XSUnG0001700 [Xanthoceras sorbifolium]
MVGQNHSVVLDGNINPYTAAFLGRIDTFKLTRYDEEINKSIHDDSKMLICAQVEAATRRTEEDEAQSAQVVKELTTIKAQLVEMSSNFNEQMLEIQVQLRVLKSLFRYVFVMWLWKT